MSLFGKNTRGLVEKFAYVLVDQSKKNINKKAPYAKKGKINSTGSLKKSIKYEMTSTGVNIKMNDYGVLRDAGQLGRKRKILKGWNKSIFTPRGSGFQAKYPKISALKPWVSRKIRYEPRTKQGLDQTTFLVARKIYNDGIQPGLFMSTPFNKLWPKFEKDLNGTISDDMDELIKVD